MGKGIGKRNKPFELGAGHGAHSWLLDLNGMQEAREQSAELSTNLLFLKQCEAVLHCCWQMPLPVFRNSALQLSLFGLSLSTMN